MTASITSRTPLESGDRLTRVEFRRRYCDRPDIKKAELVEGVVYVASPTRFEVHGEQHGLVVGWLLAYKARTRGVRLGDNATVELDADNEVQPDAFLFYDPPPARGARVNAAGYIEGAPQLVVEVAASSASYDLHDKLRAYRRNGVLEYVVWLVIERRVRWLRLREGEYVDVEPDELGVIESAAFPGLRLAVEKLLAGDAAGVLAALDESH
jgi:Uma2 family endonuclease